MRVRLFLFVLFAPPLLAQVDFATSIHPILAGRCAPCHSGAKPQAGFSVESRETILHAVVPGKPDESLLLKRVSGKEGARMPPVGEKLTDAQIGALRDWIAAGAPWTDTSAKTAPAWKAPIEPRTPALPVDAHANPIDKFIAAYFAQHKRPFPRPVGDALYLRRATLDVWGFVPAPEATEQFAASTDAQKREHAVDALLADSHRYATNWISFWNDLLRNDQGVNYAGTRKTITPWLLHALESNMPYDKMTWALLDPEKPDDPDGFLVGVNWRGDINASQTPFMQASQNSAQVFLGVNLKCASCHDSFINRYKLKQSYALAAMFAPTPTLELVRCDNKTGVTTGPEFLFPEAAEKPAGESLEERQRAAARSFTSPRDGRLARTVVNRYWQRLLGRGLVANVDDMDAEPWDADLLDWLASDFAQHNYDLKYLVRLILTSETYALPAVKEKDLPEKDYVFEGPRLRRITAEQFADSLSEMTGDWRVSQTGAKAAYAREWEMKSTPLTRALGRPIRDQVFTTREDAATTLQALELVNGETLAAKLHRGALRLLGELPEAPLNLFDSGRINKGSRPVDIDLTGAKELWLLTEDAGCYDPARTISGWLNLEVTGPKGTVRVADLTTLAKPRIAAIQADKTSDPKAIVAPPGTLILYPIEGLGFTRLRGAVAVDEHSLTSEINPNVRFFVFAAKPDPERLLRVSGEPPMPAPKPERDPRALIGRLYLEALSRAPDAKELEIARKLAAPDGKLTAGGLADLLWSLVMHPEFQYVR